MSVKRITIDDEVGLEYLRQISSEIDFTKDDIENYIKIMEEYRKDVEYYALASVQVGISKRLIYIRSTSLDNDDYDNKEYNERKIIINPTIKEAKGLTKFWESCASCGNNCALVSRPYSVLIDYYDEFGKFHEELIEGFPATVFCHEYDHLNGILHMDRAEKLKLLGPKKRRELREKEPYKIISKSTPYKL